MARGLGLDVLSVHELNRRSIADRDQLRFASEEGRIFLTRNHRDFIELTVEFYRAGEAHPGVLSCAATCQTTDQRGSRTR